MSGVWWVVGTCLIGYGLAALAFVAVTGGGILTRRHDEARQRQVAAAILTPDADTAWADIEAVMADSGLAGEVEGWLRDVTVGVTPPVIRPAAPPRDKQ